MDRLQAMTTFVAVVDTGGFASAARKLELSPPVVTRAVAELEVRLGLRLLTRTTRIVRVTEAGARYADDCRRILAEIDEAEQAAVGEHQAPKGTLTITAPVMFGQLYVTPLLARYLQQWPQLDATCLFLDRVVNLVEEGVDVAVRIGELPDSSLIAARVGRVRRVLVASPSYAAARGLPAHPQELTEHDLISAAGATTHPEWRFTVDGHSFAQRVQPRLRSTSNEAAIVAAVEGLGIARLLSYQVAAPVRSGALLPVLEAFEPGDLPIHVVHHEGRRATQKVRGFIDTVVQALRADPSLR
jgi:DNA-binding transcriptional LysR family regulator